MDFDAKAEMLVALFMTCDKVPEWQDFLKFHDLGFPFAIGMQSDMITLNKAGKEMIETTYQDLLTVLSLEDKEYATLGDLFNAAIENGASVAAVEAEIAE